MARTKVLVAVLSDIHSNAFALEAVLDDADRAGASEIWLVGDTFGYYPWAARTFDLLDGTGAIGVLGNHDSWTCNPASAPDDIAGRIARQNADELSLHRPRAIAWLESLPRVRVFDRSGWRITMTHGTPSNPLKGRYYPDDDSPHEWLPKVGEVLVLGHTHYPILRGAPPDGLFLNPGSVGQPRDRKSGASWALVDMRSGCVELRRTRYDTFVAAARLRALGWDERLIEALDRQRATV